MNKSIVKGSLKDISQQTGQSLAETFVHADAIILLDTSGSMASKDAPGGRMRHEAAEDQLRALQRSLPGKIALISFSNQVQFCPSGIPVRFDGGTDIAKALRFVKPADDCGIKFILISDGWPDDKEKTLKVARTFKSKVDCIYIGPETGYDTDGRVFLEKLAALTGGQYAVSVAPAMFGEHVEKLLLTE